MPLQTEFESAEAKGLWSQGTYFDRRQRVIKIESTGCLRQPSLILALDLLEDIFVRC